jgi:hypothetical protein
MEDSRSDQASAIASPSNQQHRSNAQEGKAALAGEKIAAATAGRNIHTAVADYDWNQDSIRNW